MTLDTRAAALFSYCDLSCELEVKGRLGAVAVESRAAAYHARPPPESPTSAILAPDLPPRASRTQNSPQEVGLSRGDSKPFCFRSWCKTHGKQRFLMRLQHFQGSACSRGKQLMKGGEGGVEGNRHTHIYLFNTPGWNLRGKYLSLFGSKTGHKNVCRFFILFNSIHPVLLSSPLSFKLLVPLSLSSSSAPPPTHPTSLSRKRLKTVNRIQVKETGCSPCSRSLNSSSSGDVIPKYPNPRGLYLAQLLVMWGWNVAGPV